MKLANTTRDGVRKVMRSIARALDKASGGRLTPNTITLLGFLMHVPIALLIAKEELVIAAVLLIVFGLMDTLDGELARLQGKSSSAGMLLDASTDRMKEVLLLSAAAYYMSATGDGKWAFIAVIACGAALCVSYVKAKGESAIATSGKKIDHAKLNRLFSDGLASFDIRMLIFVIGLLAGNVLAAVAVIAVLATYTAFFRLFKISRALSSV